MGKSARDWEDDLECETKELQYTAGLSARKGEWDIMSPGKLGAVLLKQSAHSTHQSPGIRAESRADTECRGATAMA